MFSTLTIRFGNICNVPILGMYQPAEYETSQFLSRQKTPDCLNGDGGLRA
jgi:hypothetical protein